MTMIANMFWVLSELRHYLEPANSRGKNTRELIRVFGETQEIEFVQSNDGQSLTALQTYHFSPISKDVLFMRAKLVWTTFHWYSTQSLLIVWQGTRAILFYSFIYLFLFLTLKKKRKELGDDDGQGVKSDCLCKELWIPFLISGKLYGKIGRWKTCDAKWSVNRRARLLPEIAVLFPFPKTHYLSFRASPFFCQIPIGTIGIYMHCHAQKLFI